MSRSGGGDLLIEVDRLAVDAALVRDPAGAGAAVAALALARPLVAWPCARGVGVAPGVGSAATTVCTGEGNGVGVSSGFVKGVAETVGVAVCVEVDVGAGVCAVAVGAGLSSVGRPASVVGVSDALGRRVLGQGGATDHGGVEPGTAEGDGEEFLERQAGSSSRARPCERHDSAQLRHRARDA